MTESRKLNMRVILFCPTAHSVADPIYETLKNLDEEDIVLNYSDDILLDKLQDIEQEKQGGREGGFASSCLGSCLGFF